MCETHPPLEEPRFAGLIGYNTERSNQEPLEQRGALSFGRDGSMRTQPTSTNEKFGFIARTAPQIVADRSKHGWILHHHIEGETQKINDDLYQTLGAMFHLIKPSAVRLPPETVGALQRSWDGISRLWQALQGTDVEAVVETFSDACLPAEALTDVCMKFALNYDATVHSDQTLIGHALGFRKHYPGCAYQERNASCHADDEVFGSTPPGALYMRDFQGCKEFPLTLPTSQDSYKVWVGTRSALLRDQTADCSWSIGVTGPDKSEDSQRRCLQLSQILDAGLYPVIEESKFTEAPFTSFDPSGASGSIFDQLLDKNDVARDAIMTGVQNMVTKIENGSLNLSSQPATD